MIVRLSNCDGLNREEERGRTLSFPPELDKKIRRQFGALIEEANQLILELEAAHSKSNPTTELEILTTFVEAENPFIPHCQSLIVRTANLVNVVFGNSVRGREIAKDLKDNTSAKKGKLYILKYIVGTLQGLKFDYENGFLVDLERRILSSVSTDYMAQVEGLLCEGRYVPAAVLCGAILEDALRRLYERQSPLLETANENGRTKNLNSLIQDLQKANAFNKLKADQLRSWAKVRNYAAHGEFSEFNRDDVELMVKGVKNFLADYL